MENFVVQVSGHLPTHSLDLDGSVHRQTVLQATVRDQAALYGFLNVLSDLALDLMDLRQLAHKAAPGEPGGGAPTRVEVVIRGSIGDLALAALCDHVEVTHFATRLVLADRRLLGQVLEWARDAGTPVEYAALSPALTAPSISFPQS